MVVCDLRRHPFWVGDRLGIARGHGPLHGGTAGHAGHRAGEAAGPGNWTALPPDDCNASARACPGGNIHCCRWMGAGLVALAAECPYLTRQEFLQATADMAKHRPLTGYGLGTFPEVYPRYAIIDPSLYLYVNHAHNDWAEFAADGGVPFLLLVLIPFAAAVPAAIGTPGDWGWSRSCCTPAWISHFSTGGPRLDVCAAHAALHVANPRRHGSREPSLSFQPELSDRVMPSSAQFDPTENRGVPLGERSAQSVADYLGIARVSY